MNIFLEKKKKGHSELKKKKIYSKAQFMGHQDSSVLEGRKITEWSDKSAVQLWKARMLNYEVIIKFQMESYRGLNGTIVTDALRRGQIMDMYLIQRGKVLLDWMLELLNPTSYPNPTTLLSVWFPTSWSSLSPSILSALKASNALPFFFTSRVQVYSQSRALILLVSTLKSSSPELSVAYPFSLVDELSCHLHREAIPDHTI